MCLIGVWFTYSLLFLLASWPELKALPGKFVQAMIFSSGQLLPIIQSAKMAQEQGADALFGENLPGYVYFLMYSETIISLGLIFLIGLALRNRFRV